MTSTPSFPRPIYRAIIVWVVWIVIFGTFTAISPLHMEGGYDPVREKIGATLFAPILGIMGFAAFFGGHRPSEFLMLFSFLAVAALPLVILFRCRTRFTFGILMTLHVIVVIIASVGFQQFLRHSSESP